MSFLGDLLNCLQGEEAVDYTHFYIDDEGEPHHAVADKHYIRVWLRSARIVDVRRWTTKFYATVHGQFVYLDRQQGMREVTCVIAPAKAFEEMDPSHLDRFITVNRPLLGPIPYRGQLA